MNKQGEFIRTSELAKKVGRGITGTDVYRLVVMNKRIDNVPIKKKLIGNKNRVLIKVNQETIKQIRKVWKEEQAAKKQFSSQQLAERLREWGIITDLDKLARMAKQKKIPAQKHGQRWLFNPRKTRVIRREVEKQKPGRPEKVLNHFTKNRFR